MEFDDEGNFVLIVVFEVSIIINIDVCSKLYNTP